VNIISNRQDFADYCLRQLGGGVINIEISEDQIDDNIDQAIQYYQEYHFDGIERDYLVRKITASKFSVTNSTGWSVGDTLTYSTSSATITDITDTTITISRISGDVFVNGNSLTNGTVAKTISAVVLGDADNKYIPVDDTVIGVKRVLNINRLLTSSEYLFDAKYQIMVNEIRNLTSGSVSYLYGMMTYLGNLEYVLNKEKDFRFNRRMNKIYLDINWGSDLNVGDTIALEVYKALDEDTYGEILNDLWMKKYCTALFKKQWGQNLRKYNGLQLPGGVTYDGDKLYLEAVDDIKTLEQQAIEMSAPLEFMSG
jgi:hypothetical protein